MAVVWHPRKQSPVVRCWFSFVRILLGIRVKLTGKKHLSKKQKIFLGNHISYLDIIVLGAAFDCFFVAKNDVASWPVFGFLSKLGGTVFISRKRAHIKEQIPLLKKHVELGQSLFLFPEGTTSNGRHVLAFKSSLLNVLQITKKAPVIQPISLAYTHVNNRKMQTTDEFDLAAWYADMTLPPHLWNVFRQRNLRAEIFIHSQVSDYDASQIKELTKDIQEIVTQGFDKILPA